MSEQRGGITRSVERGGERREIEKERFGVFERSSYSMTEEEGCGGEIGNS